jgi:hypothetical protein
MSDPKTAAWIAVGFLLVPAAYLLWFSIRRGAVFQNRSWEQWSGRAGLLSVLFILPDRAFGPIGARLTLALISVALIGLSLWIAEIARTL